MMSTQVAEVLSFVIATVGTVVSVSSIHSLLVSCVKSSQLLRHMCMLKSCAWFRYRFSEIEYPDLVQTEVVFCA